MKEIKYSFEYFKVYQKTLGFIDNTCKPTLNLPNSEDYHLSSPFRRTSISIALNIPEGSGKYQCAV
ncbi:hypothetical protein APS56_09225 [Pseudalgibacter alginicilyticus]|uniref:Four helix bundle protein n=1 Tax=Pseudalgibacter alginicilyticus TaxID=1736674 RepID=A0A0P0D549_9FLAO|nr:four helix bundle protein [Pseudalgibacter alginicilyticus]ALJ05293.1 hypothetical protein APS56_09225 [Pseudalgibacter alginicilyticus]